MANIFERMFSSAEWNVLVNFFAPAFDAKFQKSSIKYSNEQSSSGRSRYRSYVPLNLSDSTVPIPEFKGAVTMSITHTDAISSSFEYRDTIFPGATLIEGFIYMTNAEGKRAGGPNAYREFRDADDLLTDLKNLFPGVRALHKQPEKKMQATLLRALCVLEEDSQAGSVVPGMEPTPEQQALEELSKKKLKLETELKKREQLLEAADAKLREHVEITQEFERKRKAADKEELAFDAQAYALENELASLKEFDAKREKTKEIATAKKKATEASVQKSYWWKREDEADRGKTDIWNHRVQCFQDKEAARKKLEAFRTQNNIPPGGV